MPPRTDNRAREDNVDLDVLRVHAHFLANSVGKRPNSPLRWGVRSVAGDGAEGSHAGGHDEVLGFRGDGGVGGKPVA